MPDMISISDAAKKVGISRPRLSKLIDEAKLKKKRDGKNMLVDLAEVQKMMQLLASEKKIRTPKPTRPREDQSDLREHYKEELRRVTFDRDRLAEKVLSLEAVQTEVKLLEAKEQMHKKEVDSLITQLEIAKAQASDADELRKKLSAQADKSQSGLFKKANQLYEVIRGK